MVPDVITPGYYNKNTLFLQPKSKTKEGETAFTEKAAQQHITQFLQKQ